MVGMQFCFNMVIERRLHGLATIIREQEKDQYADRKKMRSQSFLACAQSGGGSFTCLSVCLSVYLPTYLSIYLSIHLSIYRYLSIYPPNYISIKI